MPWSWLIGVNYIDRRLYCPEFVICHWSFVIFKKFADFAEMLPFAP